MYHIDAYDNSIVVDGWERGIANDPYSGLADMRNVNIISVPGEASVNFATSKISAPSFSNIAVSSADAGDDTITFTSTPTLEGRQAVIFAGAGLPAGITAGTIYWILPSSATKATLYSDWDMATIVNITGTGTGTFSTVNMALPKHFTIDAGNAYWMVDSLGQVWSNQFYTGGGGGSTSYYWTFAGNKVPDSGATKGNGIVYYKGSDGKGWIFVIHNSSIDYLLNSSTGHYAWTYEWNPNTGAALGYHSTPTQRLFTAVGASTDIGHEAFVAPDNVVYFCDQNYIQRFYQTDSGSAFDPTNTATYTYDYTALLPFTDVAQCLAFLGTNLMVGGKFNVIYPWDTTSPTFSYPILLAESNIKKMVTVNTNTFAFVGNRGRIYITNGSQAQLWKKVPDHISNTVEPYFTWGGVCSHKNQIYFSFSVTTNSNTAISLYGGIWAVDVDTQAIRMTNKLSYDTYAGYASALMPMAITGLGQDGTGLFAGWIDGSGNYGIDRTVSNLYTGSQAVIETELIPIGTFEKPRNFNRIEYKLMKPMVSGESVTIKYRTDFSGSWTTILTDSTVGNFSLSGPVNFSNAQWVQFQIILNGTNTTPSYTRLKEIRISGINM